MKALLLSTVLTLWIIVPSANGQSRMKGLDVYGSAAISIDDIQEISGADLRELANRYGDQASPEFQQLKADVTRRIQKASGAAFVQVTLIEIYTADRPIYVTIDLVDPADAGRRLKFLPAPGGSPANPAGLITSWNKYERIAGERFRQGVLPDIRSNAHHSLWGFSHPDLEAFGKTFDAEVPRHKEGLVQVLLQSKEAKDRASAAFLLAHLEDPDELIAILTPRIGDPDARVRNNVMRVLASVARNHPRVPLPPVVTALDYPTATDRNKALAIVRFLVATDEAKQAVKREAGRALVDMLHLTQPANHNLAYVVLKRISGRKYAARDYESWEAWLAETIPQLVALPKSAPAPADNPTTAAKAELGKQLFFDGRLSGDNSTRCATCHLPERAFADGLARGTGAGGTMLPRNTPTVLNAGFSSVLLWDGRAASLEQQALGPIQAPNEMNQRLDELVAELAGIPEYAQQFRDVFGQAVNESDIARALAAYQRTLITRNSPLDRFLNGDDDALSPLAKQGLELFVGDAGCIRCHHGGLLSDGKYYRLGVGSGDHGRGAVTNRREDRYKFRTPPLRNVAQTAPYMHDGSLATLFDVVQFYYRGVPTSGPEGLDLDVEPLVGQSYSEIDALVEFLRALTGELASERRDG